MHRGRRDDSAHALGEDREPEHEQGDPVCLRREDLRAPEAECHAAAGRSQRQARRPHAEAQRGCVDEHVSGVREQRQRVCDDRGHDLGRHEDEDENERDREWPGTSVSASVPCEWWSWLMSDSLRYREAASRRSSSAHSRPVSPPADAREADARDRDRAEQPHRREQRPRAEAARAAVRAPGPRADVVRPEHRLRLPGAGGANVATGYQVVIFQRAVELLRLGAERPGAEFPASSAAGGCRSRRRPGRSS